MFDSCNVTLSKWINVTVLYRPKAHLHDMVSLISNWFILGPTERSLNSCSVIATQPTSLPYPIFIQVDYKWATWTYTNSPPQPMTGIHGNTTTPTNSTHLYTSGLQVGIPTTSLCTPLNPSMFSCIAFMPKKCGLENKKKYFFMRHNPSIPAMSPNVPFFPSTYLKWPRSCSKRSQTGLKGGSDRSHCW